LYSRDLLGQIIADSPQGKVMETKFKGLADLVLGEAKLAGCTYADVRFTMNSSLPGATANFRTAGGGGGHSIFCA
jgi:TldD protein